jgi:hypothetical protein
MARPGVVGSVSVLRAPADGYTVLFMPALVASVLPITQPTSGLQVNSFRPVCQVFSNSMALVVKPDSPIRSLRDLQAAARGNPGRMTYGTLGVTSIPHLAMVQWLGAAGVEVEHVPYRADAAVMTEVLQGRIDVGSIVLGSAAGRNDIRVLAVFDQQRHPDCRMRRPRSNRASRSRRPPSEGSSCWPERPRIASARIEAACATAAASEVYRTAARHGIAAGELLPQPRRLCAPAAGGHRAEGAGAARRAAELTRSARSARAPLRRHAHRRIGGAVAGIAAAALDEFEEEAGRRRRAYRRAGSRPMRRGRTAGVVRLQGRELRILQAEAGADVLVVVGGDVEEGRAARRRRWRPSHRRSRRPRGARRRRRRP